MISDARRARSKDKVRKFLAHKSPSLVKFLDLMNQLLGKQRDYLLDQNFHDHLKVLKQKAEPYLWAYLAGCCAPLRHRRKTARSS